LIPEVQKPQAKIIFIITDFKKIIAVSEMEEWKERRTHENGQIYLTYYA
jgi:hypothetical protein